MSRTKDPEILQAKLCKKIAELSCVVQLLFTRNHEKELELSATKKVCEDEIRRIVEEGKSKLNWLEKQLDDLERFRTLLDMKTNECERTKSAVETLQQKQVEAERKMMERGAMLSDALAEIEILKKEIASRSPEQVNALKEEKVVLSNALENERSNVTEQRDLVLELQNKVQVIETNLTTMLHQNHDLREECANLKSELSCAQDEVKILTQSLQEAKRHGERALQRTRKLEEKNKQITAEKSALQRNNEQLNEQVNKLLLSQQSAGNKPMVTQKIGPSSPRNVEITLSPSDKVKSQLPQKNDEVLYLKKEIEKYRLELKNREMNFNRVFADKTPLVIKKPAVITAEEMRLRNLTGLTNCKKTFSTLPSVVSESKSSYEFHSTRTRK